VAWAFTAILTTSPVRTKKGAKESLFQKLTALAYFLATLHNRTAEGIGVNFGMAADALINTGDAQS
jgi:hypothetical protein